jgi:hypothetical protein
MQSFRPLTLDFVSTPEAPDGIGYFPDEAVISIPVE